MCGIPSPPPPLPAGLAQAPIVWVFYALVVGLGCGRYLLAYRRLPVGNARTFVFWTYLGGCVGLLIYGLLVLDLAIPWGSAVERWYITRLVHLPPACSFAPLDAAHRMARDAANVILALGFVALGSALLLLTLADLRYRRAMVRGR